VDISAEALSAAGTGYVHPALTFRHIAPGPLPFADASFDVVVSFETIEHTADPAHFLDELWRVLRPGGPLIISTPNKRFHSLGRRLPWNPHHAVEMYPEAFRDLLTGHAGELEFWGGQEFLAAAPAVLLRKNWIEFRYYRLLGRPWYGVMHRMLGATRRILAGPAGPDTGAAAGDPEQAGEQSRIVRWRNGLEPYTMVAVCRKPGNKL
jgi:SAM-dependent methyltransferase